MLREDEDVAIFAISVDKADKTNMLVKKIARDGKGEVKFQLLSDPESGTIKNYGLIDERYFDSETEGIPIPTVLLLDKDRKVFWINVETNYRIRPSLETIRSQIDNLKKLSAKKSRMK
ncbi:MAG: redoxin domain-containing protein [Pyrinomonadaceae bacterium]|nr:redoxin domain-containing protein [Pyrinomonadaceae bacterium]